MFDYLLSAELEKLEEMMQGERLLGSRMEAGATTPIVLETIVMIFRP